MSYFIFWEDLGHCKHWRHWGYLGDWVHCWKFWHACLGRTLWTILDEFSKNFRRGGGVISDPKNYIADFFGFKTVYFGCKFWKKCPKRGGGAGVISNPKNFIANLRKLTHIYKLLQKKAQCNFQKWGGGGQRPFGIFPKKHPFWRIQTSLIDHYHYKSSCRS